jgi:hypothetical protein
LDLGPDATIGIVLNVRTGSPVPVATRSSPRVLAGRRVKAARVLAGRVSLKTTAHATGLGFAHLAAIERGEHPLTHTDCRDLAEVLSVPADWLRDGWY